MSTNYIPWLFKSMSTPKIKCMLLYIHYYILYSVCVFVLPVKHNKNKQLTFHCAYLNLFGCAVSLHVSGHGAIIRRCINA
jgi:hypothetical protein